MSPDLPVLLLAGPAVLLWRLRPLARRPLVLAAAGLPLVLALLDALRGSAAGGAVAEASSRGLLDPVGLAVAGTLAPLGLVLVALATHAAARRGRHLTGDGRSWLGLRTTPGRLALGALGAELPLAFAAAALLALGAAVQGAVQGAGPAAGRAPSARSRVQDELLLPAPLVVSAASPTADVPLPEAEPLFARAPWVEARALAGSGPAANLTARLLAPAEAAGPRADAVDAGRMARRVAGPTALDLPTREPFTYGGRWVLRLEHGGEGPPVRIARVLLREEVVPYGGLGQALALLALGLPPLLASVALGLALGALMAPSIAMLLCLVSLPLLGGGFGAGLALTRAGLVAPATPAAAWGTAALVVLAAWALLSLALRPRTGGPSPGEAP